MIKVYVAGAYSADNVLGVLQNIGKGEQFAGMLLMEGFTPFCPWLDRQFVLQFPRSTSLTVEKLKESSMAWLEVSDCLIVVPDNWEHSPGTKAEIERAKELDIPVFYEYEKLVEWRNRTHDI